MVIYQYLMILLTIENLKPHQVFKNDKEFLSIINNLSNDKELYLKCLEITYYPKYNLFLAALNPYMLVYLIHINNLINFHNQIEKNLVYSKNNFHI